MSQPTPAAEGAAPSQCGDSTAQRVKTLMPVTYITVQSGKGMLIV